MKKIILNLDNLTIREDGADSVEFSNISELIKRDTGVETWEEQAKIDGFDSLKEFFIENIENYFNQLEEEVELEIEEA